MSAKAKHQFQTSKSKIHSKQPHRQPRGQPHEQPREQHHEHPQGHLELCIRTRNVGLYGTLAGPISNDRDARLAMTAGGPSPDPTSNFTILLSGTLDDFLLYSGQEQSKWLIDISHDICDPSQKRGTLKVLDADGETWRNVNTTDPLMESIYLYDIQTVVSLSKISNRAHKSVTVATGYPSTMAHRVTVQRDNQQCWVTRTAAALVNSHVCPKRMGDHLLSIIYRNFVSTPPHTLTIYNEICGITLLSSLDHFFDKYQFGLRLTMAPNEYICHFFPPSDWPRDRQLTVAGITSNAPGFSSLPHLHGHSAGPPQPQHPHNPPPGLLRWHYLQCVIRKFVHPDYNNLPNIHYCELPFRMKGDSDDEGTDSDFEWPSVMFDRGRAIQDEIDCQEERHNRVAEWITAHQ